MGIPGPVKEGLQALKDYAKTRRATDLPSKNYFQAFRSDNNVSFVIRVRNLKRKFSKGQQTSQGQELVKQEFHLAFTKCLTLLDEGIHGPAQAKEAELAGPEDHRANLQALEIMPTIVFAASTCQRVEPARLEGAPRAEERGYIDD